MELKLHDFIDELIEVIHSLTWKNLTEPAFRRISKHYVNMRVSVSMDIIKLVRRLKKMFADRYKELVGDEIICDFCANPEMDYYGFTYKIIEH